MVRVILSIKPLKSGKKSLPDEEMLTGAIDEEEPEQTSASQVND